MENENQENPSMLRTILMQNEGLQFIPRHKTTEMPTSIDVNVIGSTNPKTLDLAKDLARVSKAFLGYDFIIDQFGSDHTARRKWRNEMAKKYGEKFRDIYENNKLRINSIGKVIGFLEALASALDREKIINSQANALRDLIQSIPKDLKLYNDKTLEEKMAIGRQIDQIAQRILEIFAR